MNVFIIAHTLSTLLRSFFTEEGTDLIFSLIAIFLCLFSWLFIQKRRGIFQAMTILSGCGLYFIFLTDIVDEDFTINSVDFVITGNVLGSIEVVLILGIRNTCMQWVLHSLFLIFKAVYLASNFGLKTPNHFFLYLNAIAVFLFYTYINSKEKENFATIYR
jgi:hypothetical protein